MAAAPWSLWLLISALLAKTGIGFRAIVDGRAAPKAASRPLGRRRLGHEKRGYLASVTISRGVSNTDSREPKRRLLRVSSVEKPKE